MANAKSPTIHPAYEEIIRPYLDKPTDLMQLLWRIQEKYNHISATAIESVATALNLTRNHVEGVARFYSFFHDTSRGQYDIKFSHNIIELMQGKAELMDALMQKLGVELGKPRADGRVTVDNTSCIGMSDQGPALLVNGYTITRLTPARVDMIVELIEGQVPLSQWPSEFFTVQDNIQHKFMLLGEYFEPGMALRQALKKGVEGTLAEIEQAGLRGCGGAGFPTGRKWKFCRETLADERYVICNADEGEPGTFKDRVLMQSYADLMFEGMTLCGYVIGAKKGFLYLRGEYRYLLESLEKTLQKRRTQGLLGRHILGDPNFSFDIEIHLGAGAYICGAELALIESLQGYRGVPQKRPPPFPVTAGYLNKPTVVNNVETFSLASKILVDGAKRFASIGTEQSKGTKLLSVSGDCERPGIYEFPFGITIREVLAACGAYDTQAVQNAGPAGRCVSEAEFDRRLCFEDLNTTGSFMIFNRQRDLLEMVRNFAQFFVHESCGFCTPCRVGTSLIENLLDKVQRGNASKEDLKELNNLSRLIRANSHCAFGWTATHYVTDTLEKFPQIYESRLQQNESTLLPSFDLDAALEKARQITQRTDKNAHF
jgi:[NiFe] hydrogenase diaphorase moiety large subunit